MPFPPGKSGNPGGRRLERPWRDAISRALKRKQSGEDPQALEKLADKLVDLGLAGDMSAIKEIGDRMDGKPSQDIHTTHSMDEMSDGELDSRIADFLGAAGVAMAARRARSAKPSGNSGGKPN